jgi:hypothetical protein
MSLIQTVTVGSGGASSISFTSIPQDGTDLLLLFSAATNFATSPGADYAKIRFNGDTGANYNQRILYGDGSTAASFANSNTTASRTPWFDITGAGAFGNVSLYISNYTSGVAKSLSYDGVAENNATTGYQALHAANWTGTAAITQITASPEQGTLFDQHSIFSLYKITSGSDGTTVVS